MRARSFPFVFALALLVAASLACNTVTRGFTGNDDDAIQLTADAVLTAETTVDDDFAAAATEAAEAATQAALDATEAAESLDFGNENNANENADGNENEAGDANENEGENANENGGEDNANENGGEVDLGDAPEDIPVYAEGEVQDFFGTDLMLSYMTDASYEDVLDFYRTEMPANEWEEATDQSFEMDGLAILTYSKGSRTALVTITGDPNAGQTSVLVTVSE